MRGGLAEIRGGAARISRRGLLCHRRRLELHGQSRLGDGVISLQLALQHARDAVRAVLGDGRGCLADGLAGDVRGDDAAGDGDAEDGPNVNGWDPNAETAAGSRTRTHFNALAVRHRTFPCVDGWWCGRGGTGLVTVAAVASYRHDRNVLPLCWATSAPRDRSQRCIPRNRTLWRCRGACVMGSPLRSWAEGGQR